MGFYTGSSDAQKCDVRVYYNNIDFSMYYEGTKCEIALKKFDLKEIAGNFQATLKSSNNQSIFIEGNFQVPRILTIDIFY